MATGPITQSMFELMRLELERQIKDAVTKRLIASELADYEAKIRPRIEALVDQVTLDRIESVRALEEWRDHLRVFLKWEHRDEPTELRTRNKVEIAEFNPDSKPVVKL